jgi:hypothetical protein
VFGSDLSLGFGATDRADELFECLSTARLVLKVFALPGESRVAESDRGDSNKLQAGPYFVGCAEHPPGPAAIMGPHGVRRERPIAGRRGRYLPHYTRWPREGSSGINVFSQTLTGRSGLYANPVFGMMLQFLSLVRDQSEGAGGGGCPWVGRISPRGDVVAPPDGVRH